MLHPTLSEPASQLPGEACPRTCRSPGPGADYAILSQKLLSHVTLNRPPMDGGTAGQLAGVRASSEPTGAR
jgi:hypothetical protein